MIVRTLEELRGTDREVGAATWMSRRLLLRKDGMGFSLHHTCIYANTETRMCYRNHVEAVYCIGGAGEIEVVETGETFRIIPGTLYALNGHEEHILRARSELSLVCVFNPPCVGDEVHGEDGAYPAYEEEITRAGAAQQMTA